MASDKAFNLSETIEALSRTPVGLDALLRGLPDSWVRSNEGGETWSAFDIVGHLTSLSGLQSLNLQEEDLARPGKHPALGAVTLSELLAAWMVHDLTHLHQLSRVMAHRYREAVGPWSAFLGVLQCNGHSA